MKSFLEQYQQIHFVGINGSGMSSLSLLLANLNLKITGSDDSPFNYSHSNITILKPKTTEFLNYDPQLLIKSISIPESHPEIQAAKSQNLKVLTYPEALGKLLQNFRVISVCGTHGKTTTTALITTALNTANINPSAIIGAKIKSLNNQNFQLGSKPTFTEKPWIVVESCEYKNAFLNYHPEIIVCTNIDLDHIDYFQTEKNYINAFNTFFNQIKPNGTIIACQNSPKLQKLLKLHTDKNIITYGDDPTSNFHLENTKINFKNKTIELNPKLIGKHNLLNLTAAIATTETLTGNLQPAIKALNNFNGISRRLEYKGKINNTIFYDDYAHHPEELKTTQKALFDHLTKTLKQTPKILSIFQPHQYTRTQTFLNEFAESFKYSSKVYIPNIFASRDPEHLIQTFSSNHLVDAINQHSNEIKATHTKNFEQTATQIQDNLNNFDAIITFGAGNIFNLYNHLNLTK